MAVAVDLGGDEATGLPPDALHDLGVAVPGRHDGEVADLVGYLAFMTDPSATTRVRIGVWVMLFLGLFTVVAWWLNREYWKDVK